MSWKVGLGHSENDLEIQGEIDFDFFEDEDQPAQDSKLPKNLSNVTHPEGNGILTGNVTGRTDNFMTNVSDIDETSTSPTNSFPELSKSVRTKRVERHKTQDRNLLQAPGNSNQSRHAKKVIETVIPNLEEPEVINIKEREEYTDEAKADDNSGPSSSSVSMTDSDGMSSLSEDLSESESITDVTPLHSPYCCDSPLPRSTLKLQANQAKEMEVCEKKEAVRFSEDVQWEPKQKVEDSVDLNVLIAAIKKLEVQQQTRRPVKHRPSTAASTSSKPGSCRSRKNMSFSNTEVRRIDQENQRLLKCIISHQTRSKSSLGSSSRTPCLPSSQINRQRKQRQIQMENMALLKRIEAAKPSRELSRANMLQDYNLHIASGSVASQSRPSSSLFGCQNARSYSLNSLSSSNDSMASPASLDIPKRLSYDSSRKQRNSQ